MARCMVETPGTAYVDFPPPSSAGTAAPLPCFPYLFEQSRKIEICGRTRVGAKPLSMISNALRCSVSVRAATQSDGTNSKALLAPFRDSICCLPLFGIRVFFVTQEGER
jgi:hypothetical protein